MSIAVLLVAWMIYFFLHSFLAAPAIKHFFIPFLAPRTFRIIYNLFSLFGILGLFYLQYILPSSLLFQVLPVTNILAICFLLTGFIIMIASIRNYDWKSFIGITDEKKYALVIGGMNKFVRHPLYSGTMLFVTGFFLWQPYAKNCWLLVIMWVYLAIGIFYEERKLVNLYGDVYRNYQKRVKKMIPFVW